MRFSVFYRRNGGDRRRTRVSRHVPPIEVDEKQFRIKLIADYNSRNRRVFKIIKHAGGLEECMKIHEKVELLKEIKQQLVDHIKSREVDAASPDDGIDSNTVVWVAGFVETWFDDRIFDVESE